MDPRPILQQVIHTFQNWGPPLVYLMFGTHLFRTVYEQTDGLGCYMDLQAAGPVTELQVSEAHTCPAGPVFEVRVEHKTRAYDWTIGLSNRTGKIELLNYRYANTPRQRASPGPRVESNRTNGESGTSASRLECCKTYPMMC
jgi:hypothetical protein